MARHPASRVLLAPLAGLALAALLPACAGPAAARADPAARIRDASLDVRARVEAVNALWAESGGGGGTAREALKRVAWQAGLLAPARIRALELLESDPGDPESRDTRAMMRLMLPVEPDAVVVAHIASRAREGRWEEFGPALVRAYARANPGVPDDQRPERAALLAIAPGRPLDETIFGVFASPVPAGLSGAERERADKARSAAWELLARLDATGERRAAFLSSPAAASADDPLLADLRAAAADLRAVPITAAQLDWARNLRRDAAWWAEARAAIASLPADRLDRWALRHAEPVRWAARERPQWLSLDRAGLLAMLRPGFKGRAVVALGERNRGETFADWADSLPWADLLTLAVIDEALRAPALVAALPEAIARDRRDTSTEYGGTIAWDPAARAFTLTVFPPRPTQRQGDRRFVASEELLAGGAAALAHFHFHVQRPDNIDYAGPSAADLAYAQDQGRACVVFTSVREGVLNADYYQPGYGAGGVVIDLGEVRFTEPGKPPSPASR